MNSAQDHAINNTFDNPSFIMGPPIPTGSHASETRSEIINPLSGETTELNAPILSKEDSKTEEGTSQCVPMDTDIGNQVEAVEAAEEQCVGTSLIGTRAVALDTGIQSDRPSSSNDVKINESRDGSEMSGNAVNNSFAPNCDGGQPQKFARKALTLEQPFSTQHEPSKTFGKRGLFSANLPLSVPAFPLIAAAQSSTSQSSTSRVIQPIANRNRFIGRAGAEKFQITSHQAIVDNDKQRSQFPPRNLDFQTESGTGDDRHSRRTGSDLIETQQNMTDKLPRSRSFETQPPSDGRLPQGILVSKVTPAAQPALPASRVGFRGDCNPALRTPNHGTFSVGNGLQLDIVAERVAKGLEECEKPAADALEQVLTDDIDSNP